MIKYTDMGIVDGDYPNAVYPVLSNTITIQGATVESNPPKVVNSGDAPKSGGPSNTPQTATGDIRNTTIAISNKNRVHRCDFILEARKNIKLKEFIRAAAKYIREGIRAVMRALGISDRSGKFTELINTLKGYARELRRIQKEIIQPIIDFEKYVLAYITKLRAIVQWILSLPARLLALLKDCLTRLLKLISGIFTDFLKELSGPGDTTKDGWKDLLDSAKDLAKAAGETIQQASTAVALGAAIPVAATAGLLIPVSQSELDAANNYITTYESNNPNVAEVTGASTSLTALKEFGFPDVDTINTTAQEMKPSTP